MLKKLMLVVALVALGCGEEKSSGNDPVESDKGGSKVKDASTRDARASSSEDAGREEDGEPVIDGNTKPDAGPIDIGKPDAIDDAGSIEVTAPDGGSVIITPGKDGGTQLGGMGSCCATHDTPGCSNAELMVCVCEKDSSCCTKAWGKQCVLWVEQKRCQPAVRDCVCAPDGKVNKPSCCEKDWSSLCDTYAGSVCEATPGCS